MIGNLLMATGSQAPISTVDMVDPFGDGSGIALYKFDGDATEESGVYNGTATNATYSDGVFGQSFLFSGSNKAEIPTTNTTHSLSFWFYLPSASLDCRGLVGRGIGWQNGMLFQYHPTYGSQGWDLTSLCPLNNTDFFPTAQHIVGWNHIYIYIDTNGDGYTIINGVKELFNIGSPSYAGCANFYDLGWRRLDNRYCASGSKLDQFRVFNRALSQEEVTALYNEGQ